MSRAILAPSGGACLCVVPVCKTLTQHAPLLVYDLSSQRVVYDVCVRVLSYLDPSLPLEARLIKRAQGGT